jgi:hypothetical protein
VSDNSTLSAPCWIRPGNVTDERHYPTRQRALGPDDPRDTEWEPPTEVRQLDKPCVIVVCDCCGDGCDDPGECMVYHCRSTEAATQEAAQAGWTRTPDGWKCGPCTAGDCDWHTDSHEASAR